jgi:hypothetical protein
MPTEDVRKIAEAGFDKGESSTRHAEMVRHDLEELNAVRRYRVSSEAQHRGSRASYRRPPSKRRRRGWVRLF